MSDVISTTFQVVERAEQPALIIRTRTPQRKLPEVLGQCYGAIVQHMGQLGQQPAGAPFAAYHNMDMEDMDIEVGIPTASLLTGRDTVQARTLPAGKAVTGIHTGPYTTLPTTYDAMMQWMTENQLQGTGVAYEFYLNDPEGVPPEALQTEIVMPLR